MKLDRDYEIRVIRKSDHIPHVIQTLPIDDFTCCGDAIRKASTWFDFYVELGCGAEKLLECHEELLADLEGTVREGRMEAA